MGVGEQGQACWWERGPQGGGSASKWGSCHCCARPAFADGILVSFAEWKEAVTVTSPDTRGGVGAGEKSVVNLCCHWN